MIKMMKSMKNMLDPNGIMNPYKVQNNTIITKTLTNIGITVSSFKLINVYFNKKKKKTRFINNQLKHQESILEVNLFEMLLLLTVITIIIYLPL